MDVMIVIGRHVDGKIVCDTIKLLERFPYCRRLILHRFNAHDRAIRQIDSRWEDDFPRFDDGSKGHGVKMPQSHGKDKAARYDENW